MNCALTENGSKMMKKIRIWRSMTPCLVPSLSLSPSTVFFLLLFWTIFYNRIMLFRSQFNLAEMKCSIVQRGVHSLGAFKHTSPIIIQLIYLIITRAQNSNKETKHNKQFKHFHCRFSSYVLCACIHDVQQRQITFAHFPCLWGAHLAI